MRLENDARTSPSAMRATFDAEVAIISLPDGSRLRLPGGEPVFARAGLHLSDVSLDCLREAGISLVERLHAGPIAAVTSDHAQFWRWGRDLVGAAVELESSGVARLLEAAVALGVAAARGGVVEESPGSASLDVVADCDVSFLLGYIAFPLLEAAVRLACRDFISLRGAVRRPFANPASGRLYRPTSVRARGGTLCRSLQDELALLDAEVASPALRDALRRWSIAAESDAGDTVAERFARIAGWRSELIHDDVAWRGRAAAALTMALLILLDRITPEEYDAFRTSRMPATSRTRVTRTD